MHPRNHLYPVEGQESGEDGQFFQGRCCSQGLEEVGALPRINFQVEVMT